MKAEQRLTYRTGFNGRGVIAKIEREELPVQQPTHAELAVTVPEEPQGPVTQLTTF